MNRITDAGCSAYMHNRLLVLVLPQPEPKSTAAGCSSR